jgi:hypothetical protein
MVLRPPRDEAGLTRGGVKSLMMVSARVSGENLDGFFLFLPDLLISNGDRRKNEKIVRSEYKKIGSEDFSITILLPIAKCCLLKR